MHCIGQTYNLVRRGATTWTKYHRAAMTVLGKQVRLVGIPLGVIQSLKHIAIPGYESWVDTFAFNAYFSSEKLYRDVPEFQPQISLESSLEKIIAAAERNHRIPHTTTPNWEDRLIETIDLISETH